MASASQIDLAYVNFFKEARGRKVVRTEDITDLNPPRFHDDFDEDRTYKVKWHLLATEPSSTEQATFDAKILCLGGELVLLIILPFFYVQHRFHIMRVVTK